MDRKRDQALGEDRAAEAITVAWMLSMLATLVAELVTVGTWLLAVLVSPPADHQFNALTSLPGLFLWIAVITGMVCLVLGPVTRRLRRSPVPRAITISAIVVGVAPLILLAFALLLPE